MYKISVYGKGGVGKSSVSSNLSYILSTRGRKVLHVGCDPKHDSTRLLTDGKSQRTFMDALVEGSEEGIVETGSNGISCVECGGAEPGVGCAGKGMISMFNYIANNTPEDTDVRVCDVLGDVVCGGFSVPMRRNQADGIILVVSEDFMSLYAANNILRGIRNLNGSECIMGMVLNSRKPEDRIRVDEFSRATGIRILGTITQNQAFSDAEAAGKTVSELLPDSESARELGTLAETVMKVMEGEIPKVKASPLNENAMTQIAAKQEVTDLEPPVVRVKCRFDRVDRERGLTYKGDQAMPACTSHGAVELLLGVTDAAIVLHGPRNCAFLMEYAWLRRSYLMKRGRGENLPDNLYSTGLDSSNIFTGDRDCLRETIQKAVADGFGTVFVVQTCTPDTIGTDVLGVIRSIECDAEIIPVEPDGYFLGSRFGGYGGALRALSDTVDWSRPVVKGRTALLAFRPTYLSEKRNLEVMKEVLEAFGLSLGPVFVDNLSMDDIRDLATCEHFIQLGISPFSHKISRTLLPPDRKAIILDPPVFLTGICEWVDALSDITGRHGSGEEFYRSKVKQFEESVVHLKDIHRGKRALFYQRSETYLDPYIEILQYLGIEPVGRLSWPQKFTGDAVRETRYKDLKSFEETELCHMNRFCDSFDIDMLISGDLRAGRLGRPWCSFGTRFLGVEGCIEWVEKLDNCFGIRSIQRWKVE